MTFHDLPPGKPILTIFDGEYYDFNYEKIWSYFVTAPDDAAPGYVVSTCKACDFSVRSSIFTHYGRKGRDSPHIYPFHDHINEHYERDQYFYPEEKAQLEAFKAAQKAQAGDYSIGSGLTARAMTYSASQSYAGRFRVKKPNPSAVSGAKNMAKKHDKSAKQALRGARR